VTRYDVSNDAIIAATPAEIVGAFLDEAAGRSHWLAARFTDVPGSYSKVMREGFRAIERYAACRRTESQA
jgi:hypothetical protein